MIQKKVLRPDRVRKINGGFSFIPHRFLTDGFLSALTQKELLLYFFLVLVSDRCGLSFYSDGAICSLLGISVDEYRIARSGLIKRDLIAFDGSLFQVLDLPQSLAKSPTAQHSDRRVQIAALIQQSLRETRR